MVGYGRNSVTGYELGYWRAGMGCWRARFRGTFVGGRSLKRRGLNPFVLVGLVKGSLRIRVITRSCYLWYVGSKPAGAYGQGL